MYCIVIVLGSGVSKMTINRVVKAVKLLKRIPCKLMFVGTNDEVIFMYKVIKSLNLNQGVILVGGSRNTLDNAYYVKSMLNKIEFSGILTVVTSRFHSWRAYQLFRFMLNNGYKILLIAVNDTPDANVLAKERLSRLLAMVSIAMLRIAGERITMIMNKLYESFKSFL